MAKMSYVHEPALQPLEHRTVMQLFDIHANNHPDREAFVLYDQTGQRSSHTFQHMQQQTLYLAASFLRLGWKRGQRVVLMIPNRIEFLVSYMALLRIGVNAILIPPAGRKVEEVTSMIKQAKSQGIVLCTSHDNPGFDTQLISSLKNMMVSINIVLVDAEHSWIAAKECSHYLDLLESGQTLDINQVILEQNQVQMDDPAMVMYTSGSTGLPKGVQHTQHSIVNGGINSVIYTLAIQKIHAENRIFIDRLFYWAASQRIGIVSVLTMGCTMISVSPLKTVKEGDSNFIMSVLQNEKCTHAFLITYIMVDIGNNPQATKYNVSSLQTVVSGGQPLQAPIFQKMKSMFPNCKYIGVYGLTECGPVTRSVILTPENDECDDGISVNPTMELKIIDEDDRMVPVGDSGEICIRSPCSFLGYLENKDATTEAISRTGWFHTGDFGYVNEKGKLTISGRKSDMIKRATMKLFPAEIEKVFYKHPDVKEIAVVGVPDVRLFEELCACVIPKEGSSLETSVNEFEEWMSHQWTPDETGLTLQPKYLVIMEELPKTKTGKTDRKSLKIVAAKKIGIELN